MTHRARFPMALILALTLALLAACGGGSEAGDDSGAAGADTTAAAPGSPEDGARNAAAADASRAVAQPAEFGIGRPAPDFQLTDIHGQKVSLSDHQGKAVLVDFWATWCGPCRRVMPTLQALATDYPENLTILAVSLDQDPAKVVPPFAEKHGLTFPMLADPAAMRVAQQWGGIRAIPTSFLIAPDGTVAQKWQGAHGRDTYEKAIREVLGLASS